MQFCEYGCGRGFETKQLMDEHVKRKHLMQKSAIQGAPSLYENMKKQTNKQLIRLPVLQKQEQKQEVSKVTASNGSVGRLRILPPRSILKQQQDLKPSVPEKQVQLLEPPLQVSSQEILESKNTITKKLLLANSGCSELSQVTHLNLNSLNLLVFESNSQVSFEDMEYLKSLSLMNNRLINVIGIGQIQNLVELNLSNNKISSLQPLGQCKLLQKIYATNNLISQLDVGLMIHIKLLHIGHNQLANFDSVLTQIRQLPSLKDLELEGNPCTNKYAYKYDILWVSFVEILDHKQITEQDYHLAQAFKEGKQDLKLNQSVMVRPGTAPIQNDDELDVDLQNDYEQEIEELYQENDELKEKVDKLEEQNLELRQTAARVPILEQQLKDAQTKLSAYETLLILKDSPEGDLREQIYLLTIQLEKTLQENQQLKQETEGKLVETNLSKFQATSTSYNKQQLDISETNSHNEEEDDDDKYFKDDDGIVQQESQEIMDLIMRNSLTLSKMKEDFKSLK